MILFNNDEKMWKSIIASLLAQKLEIRSAAVVVFAEGLWTSSHLFHSCLSSSLVWKPLIIFTRQATTCSRETCSKALFERIIVSLLINRLQAEISNRSLPVCCVRVMLHSGVVSKRILTHRILSYKSELEYHSSTRYVLALLPLQC